MRSAWIAWNNQYKYFDRNVEMDNYIFLLSNIAVFVSSDQGFIRKAKAEFGLLQLQCGIKFINDVQLILVAINQ